jgi:capsular polysaccharide biosynthesis protein
MFIEPPIMAVTAHGIQNLDSVENIQAKISAGVYSEKIIKDLIKDNPYKGKELKFNVTQPKDTRLIRISLEEQANKTDLGVAILNELLESLRADYKDIIEDRKYEVDHHVALINNQISTKKNEIALKEKQLGIQAEREVKLFDETQESKANADKLINERKSLLQTKDPKDDLFSLLYTTTIQQNITYSIQLQDELTNLKVEKESAKAEIKNLNNDINDLQNEIEKENIFKKEIHNVVLIQEPQVSLNAIRPNKKQNILLAAVLSLMIGLFLAFFMESWQKVK